MNARNLDPATVVDRILDTLHERDRKLELVAETVEAIRRRIELISDQVFGVPSATYAQRLSLVMELLDAVEDGIEPGACSCDWEFLLGWARAVDTDDDKPAILSLSHNLYPIARG